MPQRRAGSLLSFLVLLALFASLFSGSRPVTAATAADLFFSEYIEGSSNNKALEIYNGTGAPIDLAAGSYAVQMYFNGNTNAGLTIALQGTVADDDVFVLAQSSADPAILAQADQTNGAGWFNGDDAVVLLRDGLVIDSIGQVGVDPGSQWGSGDTSTADNTLRRKSGVTAGDTNPNDAFDPAVEWDGFPTNTFDGLGTHTTGEGPPPPEPGSCENVTPIAAVQGDDDVTPLAGQEVTVRGIVTAVFGGEVVVQEAAGGPRSGILAFASGNSAALGDELCVTGVASERFGMTQIGGNNNPEASLTLLSSGNPLPAPAEVTTGAIATGSAEAEQWESVLVRVSNVEVTDASLGFGEFAIDDGSGPARVDDKGSYDYVPNTGDTFTSITGVLFYTFDDYKIEPRNNGDFVGLVPAPPPVIPIGTVQGPVSDTDDGRAVRSPFAPPSGGGTGETVTVQGVIYQKTLALSSSGGQLHGLFIQNTAATDDDDPFTSDGIFVFIGRFTTLRVDGGGFYTPQVGDEVILRGPVVEFFNLTQLSNPFVVSVVRSGVDLDAEVPAFEANPPDDLADAYRYWERREGMRALIPAGAQVVGGRDVFSSTADGEVWLIRGDHPVAQRAEAYERRVFRDPHPLDNNPSELFDDGNGYRIVLGSLGVKAAASDPTTLLAPARTFDRVTNQLIGGVYFSFNKYQVQVEQQLVLEPGVDPADNAPPQTFDRAREYSVATFNVENLYDYRDDPFDGCDFVGNSGCPGVNPPFNYVPASEADYQERLVELAEQIVNDLHSPDILLIQEAEDQDICTVDDTTLTCGSTNDADGRPDTLQELASVIAAIGGPAYAAAYDRDGADDRGIVSAFLYRTDRVELLPASAEDPLLGSTSTLDYREPGLPFNTDVQNPKALNAPLPADVDTSTGTDGNNVFTRAPQVGLFRIWRDGIGGSVFVDVYAVSNHFSSGPDRRVGQRTEQAAYNAAIYEALPEEAAVVVGGDLNVFPHPDDPFAPGDELFPSDQLGPLYEAGLVNLWDRLVADAPASAYSYIFEGQAQTLDHIFVDATLLRAFVQMRAAHINADWPAEYAGDRARGASDHDPQLARFSALPTLDRLEELVRYYEASGDISNQVVARILLDRIEKARRQAEAGHERLYDAQLRVFIAQVRAFSPRWISPPAAEALIEEATLLRDQ